jgi:hypothetical protein
MPFDPRVIPPGEPPLSGDGELKLPRELAALAQQLGEDAAHLAACYPPRPIDLHERAAQAAGWRRRTVILAGSGAALALILLVVSLAWRGVPPASVDRPELAAAASSETDRQPNQPARRATAAARTTVSLAELSGPELEALLDLIERDPDKLTGVSF